MWDGTVTFATAASRCSRRGLGWRLRFRRCPGAILMSLPTSYGCSARASQRRAFPTEVRTGSIVKPSTRTFRCSCLARRAAVTLKWRAICTPCCRRANSLMHRPTCRLSAPRARLTASCSLASMTTLTPCVHSSKSTFGCATATAFSWGRGTPHRTRDDVDGRGFHAGVRAVK